MLHPKLYFSDLLAQADVTLNGSNPWDIRVKDERVYADVIGRKNLGLGETYVRGWWECPRLDEFFFRVLRAGLDRKVQGGLRLLKLMIPWLALNLQTRARSLVVAERHYNLDNDLFLSFLDSRNQYSCAYFKDNDDLEAAQERKLRLIGDKLELKPGERLLDIGCGWGGLARFMAENYGCAVTAVNIASEQLRHAREQCRGLDVDVLCSDYRDLPQNHAGAFDKIVSVGMFEHVGCRNYRTFMRTAAACLKRGGVFLLHTIGSNTSQFSCDPWIAKYIFPNGMLPSIAQIGRAAEGLFVMEDWHNLGPHYARTLMAWHKRFRNAWPGLRQRYDEGFRRMWEYYLLSCAGAFRARDIQLWQITFTRDRADQPHCRLG